MIITDKFVMLNYPKTGSSFTREILKQVHHTYDNWPSKILSRLGSMNKPSMTELMVSKGRGVTNSQHGNYRQIPEEHRHKKIASVVRNPLQRYISEYLYGWWKKNSQGFRNEINEKFHGFPDLNFPEYFEMISMSAAAESGRDVGYETIRFIKFYFRDPSTVLARLDEDYVENKRYKEDLPDITFLHQENLNNELFAFLLEMGYPEKDIAFIRDAEKINVTHRERDQLAIDNFFTANLKDEVLKKDRLFFALFPEYAS